MELMPIDIDIPAVIEELKSFILNKYPNVGFTFEYGSNMFYGIGLKITFNGMFNGIGRKITFSGVPEPHLHITASLITDLFDILKTKENVLTELKAVVTYEIDEYLQKQLD